MADENGTLTQASELRQEARSLIAQANAVDTSTADGLQTAGKMLDDADVAVKRAQLIERAHGIGTDAAPLTAGEDGEPLPVDSGEPTPEEQRADALTATPQYRAAFEQFARRGEDSLSPEARALLRNVRSMSEGVDADGGFLAPRTLLSQIEQDAAEIDELSRFMTTLGISSKGIRWIKGVDTVAFAWGAEIADNANEDQPSFGEDTLDANKARLRVRVSNDLLEDEVFGLERFLSAQAAEKKIEAEEDAFIGGSGVNRPLGIVPALNAVAGTPYRVETATIGTLAGDDFVALPYELAKRYRRRGQWLIGTKALKAARLLKDSTGQFLFSVGLAAGEAPTLAGFAYTEVESTALNNAIAGGNDIAVFGDLRRYWIVRRSGMTVKRLVEKFSDTDETAFDFKFRVGGDVQNAAAFRTLRVKSV